jgi:DNA-binding SARP family transcriptional activator
MDFRILGPLEVLAGGQALDLGGQKPRAVLAVLLLEPNRVVATSRLIEAVWEDDPPETAVKAVQVYVSQLRKTLGGDRLETKPPGYRLRLEDGELDADRARRLADKGAFDEALAHWRGEPLSDLAALRFAEAAAAGLEELRLSCLERRLEGALVNGRHLAVLGELESLVASHPLRERIRGQLMLALYRCDRQAEALEVYQAGRRLLADELGLEPGESLKQLERMILEHDPALGMPAAPEPVAVSAAPPVRHVRKTVTILLADVALDAGVLDPELLQRIANRALDEMQLVLERHGGSVERLLHGGLSAVFGAPVVHEDDALRAVRAAVELRERLAYADVVLRVGVDTGEVVTDGSHGVVGEPVAGAARLQQAAAGGEILIGAGTRRLLGEAVLAEPLPDGGHRVVAAPSGVPQRRRGSARMIGRARERHRLRDAFDQSVDDSSCQLFTILGVAGVGKSRLVDEFLSELSDATIARGRCLPYGEGITYWPVVEAIRDVLAEPTLDRLRELLGATDDADLVARRLAAVIGIAEAQGSAEEASWAVRTFFETLAGRRPLVVVFDDIHWGEPGFLDLIEQFADWSRGVPLVLVCVARPELLDMRPDWGGGKVNATTVLLQPLSEAESSELVDDLAAGALDQATCARVIAAAEGNPLFVEEMLALAVESGGEVELPPTIQALLAARLDRLDQEERIVLECAAVEGEVFHQASVGLLLDDDPGPALAALVRKDLVRPEPPVFAAERGFRFRHLLIRDAAYDSIAKESRATLHERHAAWLEQKAGARVAEYEEIVGYHLEQAFRYRAELGEEDGELGRRAAQRLGAAGRRAFLRSDSPAAVNLISRAAALLPPDDPARVQLIPNVRVVQGLRGDLTWATQILQSALESADADVRAHARVQQAFLRLFTDPDVSADELLEAAAEATSSFQMFHDDVGLARSWRLAAQAHYLARHAGGCIEASERALVHARRAGDGFEVREIVEWLAVALASGPMQAGEAERRCRALLDEIAGDGFLEATLDAVLAYLVSIQGRPEEARSLIAAAREVLEPDELYRIPYFAEYAWWADPDAADQDLRRTLQRLEELSERANTTAALLAHVACSKGAYAEAEALSAKSEAAAWPNDIISNVLWRCARARARLAVGDRASATALARDAVAFAETSDFLDVHAIARETLATALEPAEAAVELARASELRALKRGRHRPLCR